MLFNTFDKRVDPSAPPRHGRFIDPEVGSLSGEAAQQKTKERISESVEVSQRLATEYPSSAEGATYYDQPVLQNPVWIWSVPVYFYLGGTAGGALTLAAAAQLSDHRSLSRLVQRCHWIGVSGLSLGTACLIWDLGKKLRFLHMLRVFRPTSPLSVGSWLLSAATPMAGMAALFGDRRGGLGRIARAAGYGAGVLGIPLTSYTGVVLADTAIPAWQEARRMLPVMFSGSAIAGTASLLDLVDLTPREERVVRMFGALGKAAELAGTVAMEREASRVEQVGRPFRRGKTGLLWRFAQALSAASLLLSVLPGKSKRKHQIAGALGSAGALAIRFAIFEIGKASARDPRATFRMQREGHGAAEVTGRAALREVVPPAASAGGEEFKTEIFTGRPT